MSDEVSQFLEQVERLRGQQIEDDEARAREREEFLAAKRERQARREERARSISPQKSSPANTPSPRANRRAIHLSEPLKLDSPSSEAVEKLGGRSVEPDKALTTDRPPDPMAYSTSPTKEDEATIGSDAKPNDGSTSPSRASPLSWQRRPHNRSNSRLLTVVATQIAAQKSLVETQELQPPLSAQLPGMSADSHKGHPASQPVSINAVQGRLNSPLHLNPPLLESPMDEEPQPEHAITAPTGRTSPIRSTSPTKGMGGFVQSAMMKRSDSVKRWSVASPPGLTRADSIANRSTLDRSAQPSTSRPQSTIQDRSTTPGTSRPTSRHGEKETGSSEASPKDDVLNTPTQTSPNLAQKQAEADAFLPVSPSKTMEPRRWSPTKSSWLESALNKPESPPKPQQKLPPSQPPWMAEINKNKTGRGNNPNEGSRPISHKHQVSIDGLMRSSPMGSKLNLNTTGLGGIYSPPSGGNQPSPARISNSNLAETLTSPTPEPEKSKAKPRDHEGAKEKENNAEQLGSVAIPPAAKSKPEAPPKKDFRANLKPRATEAQPSKTNEPEFKSVFGTLRRTKTQNFKAPDELKENILRCKAGLSVTDGPQKSTAKDEFKDAILKKKHDFKKAHLEDKSVPPNMETRTEKPVPEGLIKRAELGRWTIGTKRDTVPERRSPSGQAKKADSPKPTPPRRKSSQVNLLARQSSPTLTPTKSPTEKFRREPDEPYAPIQPETSPRFNPNLLKKKSAPSRLGGNKLSERFNPALASMLIRGPPLAGQRAEESERRQTSGGGYAEPSEPGPQLRHMTKNRARGPRRKAPTAVRASPLSSTETSGESLSASRQPAILEKQNLPPLVEEDKPSPLSIHKQVVQAVGRSKPEPIKTKETETEPTQSVVEHVAPLNLRRRPTEPEKPVDPSTPKSAQTMAGDVPQPDSPRRLDVKRVSRFLDQTADDKPAKELSRLTLQRTGSWAPVKNVERPPPEPVKEPSKLLHQRAGSWSPIKRTERLLPEPASSSTLPVKLRSDSISSVNNANLIFNDAAAKAPSSGPKPFLAESSREVESPHMKPRGSSRPLPRPPIEASKTPPPLASPLRSPAKPGGEVSILLNDFFGSPRQRKACKIDPAEILTSYPKSGAKIKTLSFHMFLISGDGKQSPVPAHYERVLFEQEMYAAAHNFTNEAGWKVREVYFWIGDSVSETAVVEAQLIAQQEAKSLGGKLIKLRQGKETPEFLQALGGVVTVRKGSSNKYDSLAPAMLCGRRYLGQVAFDEVELTTASLCAGFAYLVTHSGKCYLWKGKGSDVDELSCARLIGMDLALTGELIEYDEGSEPASFWEMLDGGSKPHSADHWRLKPSYAKYRSRLFCSDADSRQQIFEICPFGQADLSTSSIYVLDAFFEMYIMVGSQAQSQYASFRNALDFAQEYAILAASIEDRPFIPICTVVLEGAPRDLKRVFRKWTDDRCPTILNTAADAGLKRGRSLRVVPLTQALLALKE